MNNPVDVFFPSFKIKLPPDGGMGAALVCIQNLSRWEQTGLVYYLDANGDPIIPFFARANVYQQHAKDTIGSSDAERIVLLQCGFKHSPPQGGVPWFPSTMKCLSLGATSVLMPGILPPNELRFLAENDNGNSGAFVSILFYAPPFTNIEWEGSNASPAID